MTEMICRAAFQEGGERHACDASESKNKLAIMFE
jgi:hypothetical protein